MKRIAHRLLSPAFFFVTLLLSPGVFAQNATLRGTVRDANGQNLAGASVTIQGTQRGAIADAGGNYSLSISPGTYTVVASFVGFSSQTARVTVGTGGATHDFVLAVSGDLGTVTVVGSRSPARTRIETPVPVDIIPLAQVINDVGQVDLNQILNFIAPSFQSARQTISDGTDHVDPAQLRGLGTDQVLVLVNGKRRHQSALVNVNGTVNRGQVSTDLSAIPATAIERVEILRDGAAAQYGSDAIAGVINIVLKKRTGLLEAGVSYGLNITDYEKNFALFKLQNKTDDPSVRAVDGFTTQANLGYGFSLGRGYLSINAEFLDRARTNRTGTYTDRLYPLVNGQNRDDSIMGARGLNRNSFDMRVGQSAMRAAAGFYNFAYPIGRGELYLFGGISKKRGEATGLYRYPNAIAGATAAGPFAPQVLAVYPNGFLPEIHTDITDFSSALGFRTKIGSWNADLSNTFGRNNFFFDVENSINYTQFAVTPRPQTKFNAGGLVFWQNTVNLDLSRKVDVREGLNIAAGAEYRVDAFAIGGGEEASYRRYDASNSTVTPAAQVFPGFIDLVGGTQTRNAKAAYVDLELDMTQQWLVTGALRFEHYSDFGSTLNYKFSTRYKFNDWLNARGSLSTGFRAPSMQQRFYTKTNTLFISQGGTLVPVQAGTFTNGSEPARILGIPTLKQETSRNFALGFTARPFRSLEITVDAYQIDIKDRIVLTNNFGGGNDPQLLAQLNAVGAGNANFFTNAIDTRNRGLETVLTHTANLARGHGLRTVLALTFINNTVKDDANGRPIIKASEVLRNSGQLGNYFNREDESRVEVANPRNKASLAFNYRYSKFSAMLRFVRFGEVTYLEGPVAPRDPFQPVISLNAFTGLQESTDQTFAAKTITDLSFTYQLKPALHFTFGVNNLFDVYQDRHTHSGNMSLGRFVYSRRVQQMGFNGAYYFGRLRFSMPTGKGR